MAERDAQGGREQPAGDPREGDAREGDRALARIRRAMAIGEWTWLPGVALAAVPAVIAAGAGSSAGLLATLVAVPIAVLADRALATPWRAWHERRVLRAALASARACARIADAEAEERALVIVRGTVRVLEPAIDPDGAPCAAYLRWDAGGESRAASGRLALSDGTAVAIAAPARPRIVAPPGRALAIHEGDSIAIAGRARWTRGEHTTFRAPARQLTIDPAIAGSIVVVVE